MCIILNSSSTENLIRFQSIIATLDSNGKHGDACERGFCAGLAVNSQAKDEAGNND